MDSPNAYPPGSQTAEDPAMPTQAELEAMFDADEADVAAGRVVPLEPVLAEMRAAAKRVRQQSDLQGTTTHQQA